MKKFTLYILSAMAAMALIGLLVMQGLGIRHTYTLKEQQFAELVNTTINRITEDIQSYEVVQVIQDMDSSSQVAAVDSPKMLLDPIISGKKQFEHLQPDVSREEKYAFWNKAVTDYLQPRNIVSESRMQLSSRSPDGLANMQITAMQRTITVSPRLTPAERRAKRQQLIEATLNRLQRVNYQIEKRIDSEALNYIIRLELEKSNIHLPYEYAVYGGPDNTAMSYHSAGYAPRKNAAIYQTTLFPFDWMESNPYTLCLYFPAQSNYLLRNLGVMGVLSLLFTLVVVFAFSATIYQIIRQKKIAAIRTDFVNNVTHELKTPISTISLASQMLSDKSIPDEAKNYGHISTVIADESRRLSQQVEKILQMAIFDRGKLVLKFKSLDVNELVNMVVRNMLIQIKNRNGQIVKQLEAKSSQAEVDEVHFTNVLFNLMDNAIKYSKGSPDITVSTFDAAGRLCIAVRDRGIGICKADQKRIFDQFYRVSTGNVHNVKGFGLGLTYVKNIVDAHHGDIQVESEPDNGTCFTIRIPHHQTQKIKS